MTENTTITNTNYLAGGFQYKDNALQFFPHAEGYVNVIEEHYDYVFNYTDHLGNIRVSYGVDPNTGLTKILEENHYYPFGLKHSGYNMSYKTYQKIQSGAIAIRIAAPFQPNYNYKYQGEELQTELDKNTYAYEWRDYDPAIGRFNKIDRFSEKYYEESPYHFSKNNPIYYREIKGDSIDVSWIQAFDKRFKTNLLELIMDDLDSQTGFTFSVNKQGRLVYVTNDDTSEKGSEEAREIMKHAVSSLELVAIGISNTRDSGTVPTGDFINLNQNQINSYIKGVKNINPKTQGWGMTVMHEILHSIVSTFGANKHGKEYYVFGETGKVVDRMNIVRQQLNDRGENYGIRKSYKGIYFDSSKRPDYIPYDSQSRSALMNGDIPPSMSMHINRD